MPRCFHLSNSTLLTAVGAIFLGAMPPGCTAPVSVSVQTAPPGQGGDAKSGTDALFDADRYLAHVTVLAHDELEGRGLETRGIDLAGGYIAGQFAAIGLTPGGDDGTYFQTFDVPLAAELDTERSRLAFEGTDLAPEVEQDYMPMPFSSPEPFEGGVVFAGYGIVNEEKDYDDYADIEVEGKVVLLFRYEPPDWAEGDDHTPHALFRTKIYAAAEREAAAVLIVNAPSRAPDDDALLPFRGGGNYGLPVFHVKQDVADRLLQAGGLEGLTVLETRLNDEGSVASAPLEGISASGDPGMDSRTVAARNVIGILPGQGPLADEYVVIGAHYDHLGVAPERRSFLRHVFGEGNPVVHNGADDNASGTGGVIELARALARRTGPRRGLVFIAFTGEESGLLGSRHYAANPTVPLENTVAMLNLDMIGRLPEDAEAVSVFGVGSGEEYEEMLAGLSGKTRLGAESSVGGFGGSDHAPFERKGIPAVHFFSGLHGDYHRPSDDADKINAPGAVRVLGLVYALADDIITRDQRLTYHKVERQAGGGPSPIRVVMGIMPGYGDSGEQEGMLVEGVTEDGPAAQAGMQDGDRIVAIGGQAIGSIYDYMGALKGRKSGEQIEVVVARGEQRHTLTVTLSSR